MRLDPKPRATSIIATLGPASASREILEELVAAGMDVARLNFSHGTHEAHRTIAETVRDVARRLGREVAVLQDLQGHKVRVGRVEGEPARFAQGAEVRIGPGERVTSQRIGVDYAELSRYVHPGHHVYLDDGLIDLEVVAPEGEDLRCRVITGGELGSRKGAIFPDSSLEFPLINQKDIDDARFGVELGVDMVAMSFVRSSAEVRAMRERLEAWGMRDPFIVSKVEDPQGVAHLEEILDASDAVLIARGDMGVSLPREKVPGIQERIIRRANALGVPVVTATQMLESMTRQPWPTRAEVSDVHHAVTDGTDAVMLSGETATGRYPVESVREMDRICRTAEEDGRGELGRPPPPSRGREGKPGLHDLMAAAAAHITLDMRARCILGFSRSGSTLRSLSWARCPVPVYGVVADARVLRRLRLHRGLSLSTMPTERNLDDLVDPMLARLEDEGIVRDGDRVLVVAGKVERGERRSHLLKVFVVGG